MDAHLLQQLNLPSVDSTALSDVITEYFGSRPDENDPNDDSFDLFEGKYKFLVLFLFL